jgi:hypothetical protein
MLNALHCLGVAMLRQDNDIIRIDYMKKVILFIFLFILTNSFLFGQNFGGGTGTEYDPYRIYTIEHLGELSNIVNLYVGSTAENWTTGKYFILMADITDSVRFMIGSGGEGFSIFWGNFDGNGHKITLALNAILNHSNSIALFPSVSGNVKIKNLIVDGYIKVEKRTTNFIAVATIVGLYYGRDSITIKNCINMANIYVIDKNQFLFPPFVAGIVGHFYNFKGIIEDCINMGQIIVEAEATELKYDMCAYGIIANPFLYQLNISINRCINAGYLKGGCVGGITGLPQESSSTCIITNCINIGVLDGNPDKTGAIVVGGNGP